MVIALNSDDPSWNPAKVCKFFSVKFVFEKYKNKQKEAMVSQFSTMFVQFWPVVILVNAQRL